MELVTDIAYDDWHLKMKILIEENSLKYATALVSIYVLMSSVIYLFGFWSYFGIDIMQYADGFDLIKYSAYKIVYSIFIAIISFAIWYFGALKMQKHFGDENDDENDDKNKIKLGFFDRLKIDKKFAIKILFYSAIPKSFTVLIVIIAYIYYRSNPNSFYVVLINLTGYFCYSIISDFKFMKKMFKNNTFNKVLFASLIYSCLIVFLNAQDAAYKIDRNIKYEYIYAADLKFEHGYKVDDKLKVLGKVGRFWFLLDDNSDRYVVLNSDSVQSIVVYKFLKKT